MPVGEILSNMRCRHPQRIHHYRQKKPIYSLNFRLRRAVYHQRSSWPVARFSFSPEHPGFQPPRVRVDCAHDRTTTAGAGRVRRWRLESAMAQHGNKHHHNLNLQVHIASLWLSLPYIPADLQIDDTRSQHAMAVSPPSQKGRIGVQRSS